MVLTCVLPHMPHVIGPLSRALASIDALRERPACILATGDLTESGRTDDYRRLRSLLEEIDIPAYLLPGNHDRRDALRRVFFDAEYMHGGEAIQFVIEDTFVRVVAIDSSDAPRQGGYLDAGRLDWLEARLQELPHTPTILALHHPPFPTGMSYFDEQPFEGRERLGSIVRQNSQIRRVVCGQVHQVICRPWSGTLAVSARALLQPSCCIRAVSGSRWKAAVFSCTATIGTARSPPNSYGYPPTRSR